MDAKLNQSDLISLLAKGSNISVAKAELFTKSFFDLIIEGLEQDGIVKINGLGTFKVMDVASRGSVNVNTGEKIEIKGHKKLTFIPADALKDDVNQPFAMFEPVEVDETYQPDSVNEPESEDSAEQVELSDAIVEIVESPTEVPAEMNGTEAVESPAEDAEQPVTSEEPVAEEVAAEVETNDEEVVPTTEENNGQPVVETESEPVAVQERPAEPVIVRVPQKKTQHEQKASSAKKKKSKWNIAVSVILGFAVGFILVNRMSRNSVADDATQCVDTLQVIAATANEPEVIVDDIHATDTILETPAAVLPAETDIVVETVDDNAVADEPAVEEAYTFVLVDELAAINLKNITVADTTCYVADGNLAEHTVTSDETLTRIARQYYGDKRLWPYIVKYNNMDRPNDLCRGMKLVIPRLVPRK
ncbi:MAG: HU family DNA-binding protein [Bacteroidaceae bacterium]|nr:HU family DNA-binding protein [Bacteroidaceae bacterium]